MISCTRFGNDVLAEAAASKNPNPTGSVKGGGHWVAPSGLTGRARESAHYERLIYKVMLISQRPARRIRVAGSVLWKFECGQSFQCSVFSVPFRQRTTDSQRIQLWAAGNGTAKARSTRRDRRMFRLPTCEWRHPPGSAFRSAYCALRFPLSVRRWCAHRPVRTVVGPPGGCFWCARRLWRTSGQVQSAEYGVQNGGGLVERVATCVTLPRAGAGPAE